MKKILRSLVMVVLLLGVVAQTTLLAFTSQNKISQNTFSTGRADLALFKNNALPDDPSNLTQELPGQAFGNVMSFWRQHVGVKLKNTGTLTLNTQLKVQSAGAVSDPDLRDMIKVTIFRWNDTGDGVVQPAELTSITPTQTMTEWLNEPFMLGTLSSGAVGSYVIEYEVGQLSNSYQGTFATVDYTFDALVVN